MVMCPFKRLLTIVRGEAIKDLNFNLMVYEPREFYLLGSVAYLGFSLSCSPFYNLKVRQAFNYAINKEELIDKVNSKFNTHYQMAQGPLPPNMSINPNITGYPYDVDMAKELLSQVGYSQGFNVDLYINKEDEKRNFIAKEVKKYLDKIGIKVSIKPKNWSEYISLIKQRKLPFFYIHWIADTPDPADYLYSLYHSNSSDNSGGYKNSAIDEQIEHAWSIVDKKEFLLLIQQIQQIEKTLVEDAPGIYLFYLLYGYKK